MPRKMRSHALEIFLRRIFLAGFCKTMGDQDWTWNCRAQSKIKMGRVCGGSLVSKAC